MCVGQHSNTRMNASDMITAKNAHLFQEYRPVQDSSGLPEEIDWRTSGAVSKIEDQVMCTTQCVNDVLQYCFFLLI